MVDINIENSSTTPLLPSKRSSTKQKWMKTAIIFGVVGIIIVLVSLSYWKITTELDEIEIKMGLKVEKVEFGPYIDPDLGQYMDQILPEKGEGKRWSAIGPFRKITVRTSDLGYLNENGDLNFEFIVSGLNLESLDGTVNHFGMVGPGGQTDEDYEFVVPEGQCITEHPSLQ